MGESDDARRRRLHMDDATRAITGADLRSTGADAAQSQRFIVGNFIRQLHDAGYDRMILIEMLLAGAAFLGDNYGVSREQMAKVITSIKLSEDRSLIWTPG